MALEAVPSGPERYAAAVPGFAPQGANPSPRFAHFPSAGSPLPFDCNSASRHAALSVIPSQNVKNQNSTRIHQIHL